MTCVLAQRSPQVVSGFLFTLAIALHAQPIASDRLPHLRSRSRQATSDIAVDSTDGRFRSSTAALSFPLQAVASVDSGVAAETAVSAPVAPCPSSLAAVRVRERATMGAALQVKSWEEHEPEQEQEQNQLAAPAHEATAKKEVSIDESARNEALDTATDVPQRRGNRVKALDTARAERSERRAKERRIRQQAHHGLWMKRLFVLSGISFCIAAVLVWQYICGGKPFNLIWFLPLGIQACFPSTFLSVQDVDHLMLIVLFLACIANIIMCMLHIWSNKGWLLESIALVMLVPCLSYTYQCISSYDDRLCTRREEVEKRREEIANLYQNMLEDCEHKLQKATESNAGLAEQHFESRKRDFCRFLDWLSEQELGDRLGEPDPAMLGFDRFIRQWLRAFEETSLDPVRNPRRGDGGDGFEQSILNCQGISENARYLREMLLKENVEFIKAERDLLLRKKLRHSRSQEKSLMRKVYSPIKAVRKRANEINRPTWISCGIAGFGIEKLDTEFSTKEDTPFPMRFKLGCVSVVMVNSGHVVVLIGLLIAPILCTFFIIDGIRRRDDDPSFSHIPIQTGLLMFSLCMAIILWDFERIDALMCLEQEIAELDTERDEVIQQRVRISEFFGKSQALVDFWTTRTLPMLDLLKALHERVEDSYRVDKLGAGARLDNLCDLLDILHAHLGSVEAWKDAMNGDWADVGESKKEIVACYVKPLLDSDNLDNCMKGMEDRMPALRCVELLDGVRDRACSGMDIASTAPSGSMLSSSYASSHSASFFKPSPSVSAKPLPSGSARSQQPSPRRRSPM